MRTRIDRRAEMLRRGGIDPIRLDKRPIGLIMGDAIPYANWARQWFLIKRLGFKDHQHFLQAMNERQRRKDLSS